ncbi:MAG: hypothetical protein M1818_000838 [Claussenomyces sp. TS43310]|nr:MAG: hypothetical protein M1818_000838 [Claussenomyces sp. TS43310]
MASANSIPDAHPQQIDPQSAELGDDEPLLGRAGGASQPEGRALFHNLIIELGILKSNPSLTDPGTAVIAQGGLILLTAIVWASIFLHPLSLFSAHPLLNSSGIFIFAESILLLQPTHTPEQKRRGTIAHAVLNTLAADALLAGLVIIEYNKFAHDAIHFTSPHGILGLITYIFLAIQVLIGFTQYFVPQLYGSADTAKAMYKWHRLSGYIVLSMMLATVAAATETDTGKGFLKLKLWAVLVSAALVLIGVLPRIKKQKLGLPTRQTGGLGSGP